jgi:Uma2 family endonuclease
MRDSGMVTNKLLTAEDLWEMEDDGCRHELINGELISMPPTNEKHGVFMWRLSGLLFAHYRDYPEFLCFVGDTGILLKREPDIVLAPDISVVRSDRLPPEFPHHRFSNTIPDLAIEIISPLERAGQIGAKVDAYLESGARLIWLVNPMHRSVTVHSPDHHTYILEGEDVLDGGEVLPEFELPLRELFGK